jgi:hypothetical protein
MAVTLRRPASLRGRLALLALLTTAGWMLLLTAGFNLFLGARLRAEANDLLRTRAAAVSATGRSSAPGHPPPSRRAPTPSPAQGPVSANSTNPSGRVSTLFPSWTDGVRPVRPSSR